MSNYIKKAAAHARLMKLASAARLIRRQRALQKYAQAVQMQKAALSTGAQAAIGAGIGGLLGGGIGYGLGKKDKKLLSTLIGAGAGAGIGAGGTALFNYLIKKRVDPVDAQAIVDALSPTLPLPGEKNIVSNGGFTGVGAANTAGGTISLESPDYKVTGPGILPASGSVSPALQTGGLGPITLNPSAGTVSFGDDLVLGADGLPNPNPEIRIPFQWETPKPKEVKPL